MAPGVLQWFFSITIVKSCMQRLSTCPQGLQPTPLVLRLFISVTSCYHEVEKPIPLDAVLHIYGLVLCKHSQR